MYRVVQGTMALRTRPSAPGVESDGLDVFGHDRGRELGPPVEHRDAGGRALPGSDDTTGNGSHAITGPLPGQRKHAPLRCGKTTAVALS
ncbi:hypothetical protein GCM10009680_43290 [Streptomyces yatensis]|uniref:Uncharacterized protein n=1 Tax=Streptomyces yatensis TaxID=155177 RepID=A0ABN2I4C1_9ACTN